MQQQSDAGRAAPDQRRLGVEDETERHDQRAERDGGDIFMEAVFFAGGGRIRHQAPRHAGRGAPPLQPEGRKCEKRAERAGAEPAALPIGDGRPGRADRAAEEHAGHEDRVAAVPRLGPQRVDDLLIRDQRRLDAEIHEQDAHGQADRARARRRTRPMRGASGSSRR